LSGKHGLLDPGQEIAPYEQRVALKGPALEVWAVEAAVAVKARHGTRGPVELLMGRPYAAPLGRALDVLGVSWCAPLDGFGTGHRLQWLTARVQLAYRERLRVEREQARAERQRGAA
jgi:hypothetical protein